MDNSQLTRLRITFAKTEAMRFTGHLDLHRAWERSFRRAQLPLAYSQGYNPHPRLNLASALPLGFTSRAEVIDAWLEDAIPPEIVQQTLTKALPPGMIVLQVEIVDLQLPALQTALKASEFLITFLEPVGGLSIKVESLLAAQSLPRRRRNRDYDLRPLIFSVEILTDERPPESKQSYQKILVQLSACEGATGRPEEVVELLGVDPQTVRVERMGLIFQKA